MFIEGNNKDGNRILINVDAIAYVDLDAVIWIDNYPNNVEEKGVRVYFQTSRGGEGKHWPAFQDFRGKEAENLRVGLAKILEATRFSD